MQALVSRSVGSRSIDTSSIARVSTGLYDFELQFSMQQADA